MLHVLVLESFGEFICILETLLDYTSKYIIRYIRAMDAFVTTT